MSDTLHTGNMAEPEVLKKVVEALGGALENAHGSRELILVVDDEPQVLFLNTMLLVSQEYRVIQFASPACALEAYRQLADWIDLVVLDFAMPELDGEELFLAMQEVRGDVRAVLVSGYADQKSIKRMFEAGLKGYLGKPFQPEELYARVTEALAG